MEDGLDPTLELLQETLGAYLEEKVSKQELISILQHTATHVEVYLDEMEELEAEVPGLDVVRDALEDYLDGLELVAENPEDPSKGLELIRSSVHRLRRARGGLESPGKTACVHCGALNSEGSGTCMSCQARLPIQPGLSEATTLSVAEPGPRGIEVSTQEFVDLIEAVRGWRAKRLEPGKWSSELQRLRKVQLAGQEDFRHLPESLESFGPAFVARGEELGRWGVEALQEFLRGLDDVEQAGDDSAMLESGLEKCRLAAEELVKCRRALESEL